jgi:hypothetical protein
MIVACCSSQLGLENVSTAMAFKLISFAAIAAFQRERNWRSYMMHALTGLKTKLT